ncbi:MAG: response regulator [Chloroflexi bacterium]|nr:response regulator [Chloroflexota bacterium]
MKPPSMTLVLVVDDSPDIVTLLRMVLEQRGYQVITGRNGREGLEQLYQVQPDAIISNLFMPQMDGLAFLDAVRSDPNWASIPFIIASAVTSNDYRETVFAHGTDGFLPKPFKFNELHALLRDLGISPQ